MRSSQTARALLFAATLALSSHAHAWARSQDPMPSTALSTTAGTFYDRAGFPRCVASATDPGDGAVFVWDQSLRYPRRIFAASIRDLGGAALGCRAWPQVYAAAMQRLSSLPYLAPTATEIALTSGARIPLTADTLGRLAQARRGSNSYVGALTAQQYLAARPIAAFTRALNRQIASQLGVGFAGDVYKAWVESLPRNGAMKARIQQGIRLAAAGQLARPTTARYRGYKILVAEGFMQTPQKNRMRTFYSALDGMGIAHSAMRFDPVGTLASNAALFEQQIEAEMRASNQRLILTGASKGVPELMMALGNLHARQPTLVAQRVTAVLTMAGMYEGSYLVDWASGGIQSLLVGGALRSAARDAGLTLPNLDGFHAMSSRSLYEASQTYSPRLPNLLYIDFVGVLTGEGFARDPEILRLQRELAASQIDDSGGNDGYIEYPGTMLPRSWRLNSTEVVFDSSHAIVDGFYDGHDLADLAQRRVVFDGIFQAVADLIEGAGGR